MLQALDPSIIKTIDVREGDRSKRDNCWRRSIPTFTAADVKQFKLQIASLETQVDRAIKAELERDRAGFPAIAAIPSSRTTPRLQKALYDQRAAQYRAQDCEL